MMSAQRPTLVDLLPELQADIDEVWTKLVQVQARTGSGCFLFTGADADAGTTILTACVALSIALHRGEEVLLVETDVENPKVAGYLGIPGAPGLAEYLVGDGTLTECQHFVEECPRLRVLPAGPGRRPVPGELASERMTALFEASRGRDRFLVLDAPPIHSHPEDRVLLDHVDGVVLVLRARTSRRDVAQKSIDICEAAGVPVLGIVLNRFRSDLPFGIGGR